MSNPFDSPGAWLRCALHTHTTNSDGALPPEMLVRHYEWAGFDVLAITDHWVRTVTPSTNRLVVVPRVELDTRTNGTGDTHLLALGVESEPPVPETAPPPLDEAVQWAASAGGVPYLKGSSVNAGRLGHSCRSEILASDDRGLVTEARLELPAFTPCGRLELRDGEGRRAWTNPLWIS